MKLLLYRDSKGRLWAATSQESIERFLRDKDVVAIFTGEIKIRKGLLKREARGIYTLKGGKK